MNAMRCCNVYIAATKHWGQQKFYINVKQSFEIVHVRQELQLRIRQSIIVYKAVLSIVQFTIVNDLKYWTANST